MSTPASENHGHPAAFTDRAGALRALAEKALADIFRPGGMLGGGDTPAILVEAMRHAVLGGGKRMRPVLCLAVCQAFCGDPAPALDAAIAIELLHSYTLVHDDLPCMDNDAMRRGLPTVHAKYGDAEAVLVGDALQAAAFQVLSAHFHDDCVAALASAAGPRGVIGGQWVDVTAKPPHDMDRVNFVHTGKTAALISCACRMGAIRGGADEEARSVASNFGHFLGMAFQAVDDILDSSDPRKTDELSLLRVVSPDKAADLARQHTAHAEEFLAKIYPVAGLAPASAAKAAEAVQILRDLAEAQLSRVF